VRSHAKASTAGSTQRQAGGARPGLTRLACLAAISLLALLAGATPALGAVVTDRPLLFKFDGSDTTAGAFGDLGSLEVNQATGDVYVLDNGKRVVDRFNAAGVAQTFAATGASSLSVPTTGNFFSNSDIAIDNSGVNPGRIYVQVQERFGRAFDPAGNFLWELPEQGGPFESPCAAAFDTAGHLWVSDRPSGTKRIREFAATGSPPAQLGSFNYTSGGNFPCRLDLDTAGNVYISADTGTHKYSGGVFASTLDAAGKRGVAVDRSSPTGHIFTRRETNFGEYDSSGALVGTFGEALLGLGLSIAYNSSLDRVYVANTGGPVVFAFGPVTTGTVPDATSEAASEVGVSKAKFSGKVNPQSVPNEYFFEWKVGTSAEQGWGAAKSSTPQALPEDSSEHAVSFNATGLKGNTTHQVRVVVRNTANGLASYSNAVNFTTAPAATAPAVTIAAPSAVTTTSAQVSGTVNPKEDFGTTWRLQTSTDPACASGFTDHPIHSLESEANTPVAVAEELTGLLPSQHYCVRMTASNSFGSATSETKEFTTDPAVPSQVFTAFAAPRTDTTARLNGRVDPEGAPLTYSFEYSKDGGATWIDLPDGEETSEGREQIVVASELSGLAPNTTYHYRFNTENAAGDAQGEVETFTTRTSAQMSPPERGIELVNNPDKGNQRVNFFSFPLRGTSIISADGEKALWTVTGGAPGGTTGTGASFLAKRTADGWRSSGLIPPASQQVGSGELAYTLAANTPDFSKFIFRVAPSVILGDVTDPVAVRLDEGGNQQILKDYEAPDFGMEEMDVSDDGAHVLVEDPLSDQLEDVGSGVPEVVSLMPDGTQAECLLAKNVKTAHWQPDYHVMSTTDGSRVYFQAKPNGSCAGLIPDGLYVRNRDSAQTTLIDPGASGQSPELIRATPDGRGVYFASPSQLDPADANGGKDVYRWDEASGESSCLTCVVADARVEGSVMVSDDFSHVYFESKEQLVAGQGEAGHRNAYALSGGELNFMTDPGGFAVLSSGDPKLSADGNVLAFRADARRSLTADDVAAECFDAGSANTGCLELYRYDDRDGSTECVSCDHEGTTTESFASHGGLSNLDFRLSADGSTIGFLTPEGLVHLDVNKGFDVYEWREGARRLITDGVSTLATGLSRPMMLASDADGSDLLFAIVPPNGSLTGFEQDGQVNLYDARIGGGFEPPGAPVHCKEDSCQGPLVSPPVPPPASSSSFAGRGNLAPQKARKKRRPCARKRGKAKQRCVRKQKRRAQRARANHNAGRGK
jgi:hypothetical protein